jgi:hypothetical protein
VFEYAATLSLTPSEVVLNLERQPAVASSQAQMGKPVVGTVDTLRMKLATGNHNAWLPDLIRAPLC